MLNNLSLLSEGLRDHSLVFIISNVDIIILIFAILKNILERFRVRQTTKKSITNTY